MSIFKKIYEILTIAGSIAGQSMRQQKGRDIRRIPEHEDKLFIF